jgi:anti-anti-sigma factor
VQRELDVLRVEGARVGRVPRSSDEVVADLDTRFTGYRSTMDTLNGLVEQGADHADVLIPVLGEPAERADAVQALADLLDEIDAYCEAGDQLLTLATPPDLRQFRAWLFHEVIGQLRGAAPSPWSAAHEQPPAVSTAPRSDDAPVVVRESGSLDLGQAARVRESLQSAFTANDADVRLDLTDVDFVDSVMLSVFITAHKRFAASGRRLSFVVPPNLLRVFELTGLVGVLDVRAA